MNFIEKLSCTLGKQYLYKEGKDEYWNRYIGNKQTKQKAQDWLIQQFNEMNILIENEECKTNDNIKAIFCKSCNNIIYSRSKHDYRSCTCGKCSVDGGRDYIRVIGDLENIISIELDPNILLEQILFYDFLYQNKNASQWKNGYYGKFELDDGSNEQFYKRLIVKGFDEVWHWLQNKNIGE